MVNSWNYKLFLVENASQQMNMLVKSKQLKDHFPSTNKDILNGTTNYKESSQYAQYTRDLYGNSDPSKEAWFTTYILITMISESAGKLFNIRIMALYLSLNQNPETTTKKGLKFILKKLAMVNGGTCINRDKRGFHGASSVVEEEEICITWLLVSSKTEMT